MADAPNKQLAAVIDLFPDRLENAAKAHSEESFVRNALVPLLRSTKSDNLRWLPNVVTKRYGGWMNVPESDRITFAKELSAAFREASEELRDHLLRIGHELELRIEEPEGSQEGT
ncbi:hypothetical protein Pr1d_35440 [Bythopirellula goksoeyrii]|uniref:Uncharacterized protein n=2 Tax=Bythopirellula goksoeyrii TaxID=1400387 RepID=A0A5B9QFB3_9BACT|nr:hypothetical protein Pr1d_35440 [Bythopirellula goksoeyrii]